MNKLTALKWLPLFGAKVHIEPGKVANGLQAAQPRFKQFTYWRLLQKLELNYSAVLSQMLWNVQNWIQNLNFRFSLSFELRNRHWLGTDLELWNWRSGRKSVCDWKRGSLSQEKFCGKNLLTTASCIQRAVARRFDFKVKRQLLWIVPSDYDFRQDFR